MKRGATGPGFNVSFGAVLATALAIVAPDATAQQVTVTARDGSISLSGEMLGFDGEYFRLQTVHGELTLRLSDVVCDGAACPDPADYVPLLSMSGGDRMAGEILPALIGAFSAGLGLTVSEDQDVDGWRLVTLSDLDGRMFARIRLRGGGTEAGLDDLIAGQSDMLLAGRVLTDDEIAAARAAGLGRLDTAGRVRVLAYDAFIPVAAPGQPVGSIGQAELAQVLSGSITGWAALGGPDIPIRVYLADDGDGQVQGLLNSLLGMAAPSPPNARLGDVTTQAALIAADSGGLGLLPFDRFGENQPLILRDSCGLRSIPRPANVRTGDYPLTAPLYLYRPMRRLSPVGQAFLDWLSGAEAQLTLRRLNLLGADAVPIPLEQQGERLAAAIANAGPEVTLAELQRMVATLAPLVRLTHTFRFQDGSTELEPAARSNVLQLAHSLATGRHAGQRVVFVGFSDGRGPAGANRDLSAARAEEVRREVLAALGDIVPPGVTFEVEAFGEALPMGCDETRWGQRMNRRVELWVSGG